MIDQGSDPCTTCGVQSWHAVWPRLPVNLPGAHLRTCALDRRSSFDARLTCSRRCACTGCKQRCRWKRQRIQEGILCRASDLSFQVRDLTCQQGSQCTRQRSTRRGQDCSFQLPTVARDSSHRESAASAKGCVAAVSGKRVAHPDIAQRSSTRLQRRRLRRSLRWDSRCKRWSLAARCKCRQDTCIARVSSEIRRMEAQFNSRVGDLATVRVTSGRALISGKRAH